MPEPNPPAVLRHHVLSDPTGRRRHRLVIAGRVVTTILALWLIVLILGGIGFQPLAGLPLVDNLGTGAAAPPALPERVQAAVNRHTTVAAATGAAKGARAVPKQPRRAAVTSPSRANRLSPARTTPATRPVRRNPTTRVIRVSPAPAPSVTPTSLSSTTAGPSSTTTGRPTTTTSPPTTTTSPPTTAPGQTRTPPGQTKTEPGPPITTPGGTPGSKGKTRTSATVTAP
jgi:hypothetical protein